MFGRKKDRQAEADLRERSGSKASVSKADSPKKDGPKKPATLLGKIWYFIWHDDSVWSFLVNIILAYLIIKFIVFPLFGLIFGTSVPLVAVVSESMEHNGVKFDDWWAQNSLLYERAGITKEQFSDYSFKNGFNKGDIMVLVGKDPAKIDIGDVIVYRSMKEYPIIHRVIAKREVQSSILTGPVRVTGFVFETKGDNNPYQIQEYRDAQNRLVEPGTLGAFRVLDEKSVEENLVLGKAVARIPFLGYVKIWFVDLLRFLGIYGAVGKAF